MILDVYVNISKLWTDHVLLGHFSPALQQEAVVGCIALGVLSTTSAVSAAMDIFC